MPKHFDEACVPSWLRRVQLGIAWTFSLFLCIFTFAIPIFLEQFLRHNFGWQSAELAMLAIFFPTLAVILFGCVGALYAGEIVFLSLWDRFRPRLSDAELRNFWWCERDHIWKLRIPEPRESRITICVNATGYEKDEKFWSRVRKKTKMYQEDQSLVQPPITEAILSVAFKTLDLSRLSEPRNLNHFWKHTYIDNVRISKNEMVIGLIYMVTEQPDDDIPIRIAFDADDILLRIEEC